MNIPILGTDFLKLRYRMSYTEIFLLAWALSIDACIISFSYGLCIEERKSISSAALALTTGIFQAIMPITGFFLTNMVKLFIIPYSKFIVFIIFMYLGFTIIRDAFKNNEPKKLCVSLKALLLIGIATSMDAFSAGISLSLTDSPVIYSAAVIGVVTFINSIIGYWCGCGLKVFKTKYLEITGGLVLIFLAIKNIF